MKYGHRFATAFAALAWIILVLGTVGLALARFASTCSSCDTINIGWPAIVPASTAALIGLCLLYRTRRRTWPVLIASAVALLLLVTTRPPPPTARPCGPGAAVALRVVEFNAWENNRAPAAAAAWLLGERPDVIILLEAKGRSASLPQQLRAAFPYQQACLRERFCSTFVLSRVRPSASFAFGKGDVENRESLSAAAMTLPLPEGNTTVVAVHLSRPWPWGRQSRELAQLRSALVGFDPHSLIVAGDFNSTPETRFFRGALTALDLRRIPSGATWPSAAVRPWMWSALPLDHVLLGDGWRVSDHRSGPVVGSDHLPTLASLCRVRVADAP